MPLGFLTRPPPKKRNLVGAVMLVLSKYKDIQTYGQTASIVQKDLQGTAQLFSWCVYSKFMFTPFQEYSLHTQACCRGAAGRGGPG